VTGYEYWLITDYPGGTGEGDSWEEGWFDYFWNPKGITPREEQEINAPVLLMTDAGVDKRTLWNDEARRVRCSISDYGEAAIQNGTVTWTLTGPGGPVAHDSLENVNVELGNVAPAGEIEIPPLEEPPRRSSSWLPGSNLATEGLRTVGISGLSHILTCPKRLRGRCSRMCAGTV
jgi:hypothetical protein